MATARVGTADGAVYDVMRWIMSGSLVAEWRAVEKPFRLPWSRLLSACIVSTCYASRVQTHSTDTT